MDDFSFKQKEYFWLFHGMTPFYKASIRNGVLNLKTAVSNMLQGETMSVIDTKFFAVFAN